MKASLFWAMLIELMRMVLKVSIELKNFIF